MLGPSNQPEHPIDNLSKVTPVSAEATNRHWYDFFPDAISAIARSLLAHSKAIGLSLAALFALLALIKPSLIGLPGIDYIHLHANVAALNAPDRVRKILLFFVEYNVFLVLCALFGAGVGASEILSRYRDEPFLAISSPPGRRYLAVNAGISLVAFYLLHHFGDSMFSGLSRDPLLMSIVAGFGAMVVMRSKIFSFKTEGGENYAIGPDAVLSTFLSSVDRQIDRYRASRRQSLVYEETQGVENPDTAPDFFRSFLVSYQNLSNDEKGDIDDEVKIIYEQALSPRLKFMTAAFGFLNIMGESNFKALVEQLKKYQQLPLEARLPDKVGLAPVASALSSRAEGAQLQTAVADSSADKPMATTTRDGPASGDVVERNEDEIVVESKGTDSHADALLPESALDSPPPETGSDNGPD